MMCSRILPHKLEKYHNALMSFILIVISFIFLPSTVLAGSEDFSDALDVTLYKLASENNDSSAQYLIARKYLRGKAVVKNTQEAIRWLKFADKQGHAKAQFQLGMIYLKGLDIKVDAALAKTYLLRAANNGLDDAQFQLGQFYRRGLGGTKNIHKAVQWYKKSIKQDNILAQYILGKMYLEGTGVKQSNSKAVKWLTQAAGSGDFQAAKLLAKFQREYPDSFKKLQKSAKKPIKRSKKKSAKKAISAVVSRDELDLSAEQMLQQGMNYLHGDHGFELNAPKGVSLLKRAAKKGHAVAQFDYGVLLSQGTFVDTDLEQSVKWLTKAANAGVERAKGVLVDVRLKLMLSNKKKYASKPNDQYEIASQYLLGNVINKDIQQAFKWYLKAARQKHLKSQYQVGAMYHTGSGVIQNPKKAEYWLVKAARRGISEADNLLLEIDIEKDRVAAQVKAGSTGQKREQKTEKTIAKSSIADNSERVNKNVEEKNDISVAILSSPRKKKRSDSKLKSDLDSSANSIMKELITKAKRGESQHQFMAAKNYLAGVNVDKNVAKGIEWLTLSANNKHITAQLQLGAMFLFGDQVEINYQKAYRWINMAAEEGDITAQLYLGDMYKKGLGVKRSNSKAIKWYRKSANRGNLDARKRLGGCRVC